MMLKRLNIEDTTPAAKRISQYLKHTEKRRAWRDAKRLEAARLERLETQAKLEGKIRAEMRAVELGIRTELKTMQKMRTELASMSAEARRNSTRFQSLGLKTIAAIRKFDLDA